MTPRIDLVSAIPLPAPFSMFIEPTNVCNFACPICPESFSDYEKQAGYYGRMPTEVWRELICDLEAWGISLRVMRFYYVGEPLLNPNLAQMISQASAFADRLELTTNASLLTERRSMELLGSGLDYLKVSVFAVDRLGLATGSHFSHVGILENVRRLRVLRDLAGLSLPVIHAQLVSEGASIDLFHEQWDSIADCTDVQGLHNWGSSDFRLVQIGKRPQAAPLVCAKPFYELAVHANGDVSVCCVDWNRKLVIGNLLKESLKEMWHGEKLNSIQRLHATGHREALESCRDCTLIYEQKDNLDRLVQMKSEAYV